ncbi:hypothetical protein SAMN04488038_105178 [Solimonas aquatica]|uniref:Uncharacterized protein n=1 Tax=Solimonas aquatica TaxID=489703 RepID=A0A1H9EWJ2_9GAMM|nr:hypothetical protein [Solimonas aquatica]SEQ29957.1 hypothetical protein SAMN04488038_105178 [Solimonas aquatica]
MASNNTAGLTESAAALSEAYSQHAGVLRTWLVAYGIGAPALFLSQDKIWEVLAKSGRLPSIGILFLAGVALQVVLAAVNKSVMWACYYGEMKPAYKDTRRYKLADWLSRQYAIDFVLDLISMGGFGIATYQCFVVLSSSVIA